MANTVYSASLIMTADVNQAKAQLKDLQQSLNSLMKTSHDSSPLGLTQEIAKATSDVAGLKAALQSATNTNTGKLDLSKFSQGLNAAKLDIKQVASSLQSLGPAGQQAFSQLATSIMSAEIPLKKTNKLLNDFKTTLGNTVKWQISSSMVNSLFGAMQHAYGYAKDLNKSLNDIRIVTGYSTDQMSKFAKEANNAAKALSTTTTQYTDAALIYYQQGLAEKDIKARTDATIKMANVTGESAKAVSDYMTAIWNNFDDGSKSIEYYADVMTALGAATASSTDEIAAGLEKFAAVSETVGLSYEYATAALATVTAETRQSADVVGNAFKTLFSRIQGLNLGETMDDGTDLNKYSSALAKVGINIKDTNGQIKQMDVILDELGAKWGTLSNDTQMALAQAVAGVRQYNQLISLMENWDTFKINLEVAEGAEGTLQEQADIYAESWQAAADRVEASFQDIYDSILNDEFFIKLTDFFGGLIDVIGNTVDGIGGMSGAFAALGIVATRVFGKDIAKGLSTLNYNLHPEKREQDIAKIRNDALTKLREGIDDGTFSGSISSEGYKIQADWQQQIIDKSEKLKANGIELNEIEKIRLGLLTDQLNQLLAQEREQANAVDIAKTKANNIAYRNTLGASEEIKLGYEKFRTSARNLGVGNSLQEIFTSMAGNTANEENGVESFKKSAKGLIASANKRGIDISAFEEELEGLDDIADKSGIDEFIQKLQAKIQTLGQEAADARKELEQLFTVQGREVPTDNINQEAQAQTNYGSEQVGAIRVGADVDAQQESNINNLNDIDESKTASVSQGFMALGDAISSTALVLTSFISLYNIWNDEDATAGEKLLTTLTTVATVLPMVTTAFSKTNIEMIKTLGSSLKAAMGFTTAGAAGVAAGAGGAAAGTGFAAAAAGLWSLLWPIGLVIAAVMALIGVFTLISEWIDGSNWTMEEQIEASAEAVEELTNVLSEATDAAEELNNAFDKYDNAVKALEDCTKGTKEYYEALEQANAAALELINNNPELDYDIIDGQIKINEQSKENLLKQSEQNIAIAEIAKRKEEEDLRDLKLQKEQDDYEEGSYTREKDDFIFDTSSAYVNYDEIQKILQETQGAGFGEKLVELEEQNGRFFSDYEGATREDYIKFYNEAAQEYLKASQEYHNTIKQNRQSDMLNAKAQVVNYLGAEKASQYTNEELSVLGAQANYDIEKAIQTEFDYYGEELDQSQGQTQRLRDDWEIYKRVTGNSDYELIDNAIQGKNEDRKIVFKNAEGVEDDISAQTFANIIGTAKALEEFGVSVSQATSLLQNLANIEVEGVGTAISSMIANNDLSQMTEQDLADMKEDFYNKKPEDLAEGETWDLTNVEDMTSYLIDTVAGGDGVKFQEIYQTAGFDSANAFVEYFIQEMNNQETALADSITSSFPEISEILNKNGKNLNLSTFDVEIREKITTSLENAFKLGGEEGLNALYDILSKVDPSQLEDFLNIYKNFDWTQDGAQEKFIALLKESDIKLGDNEQAFYNFAAAAAAAGASLPIEDLGTFIEQLETILGLINDLKMGDIVDQETIDQLKQWGIDTEKYFTKGLEGQYTMTKELTTEDAINKARGEVEQLNSVYTGLDGDGEGFDAQGNTISKAQMWINHAQNALDVGDADTAWTAVTNLGFDDMTEEQTRAIFKMDPDAVQSIIDNADLTGMQDLLSNYISFMSSGMAGEYSQDAINAAGMKAAAAAGDVNLLGQQEGFYDDKNNISQTGREQLEIIAAGNEDYAAAYAEYQAIVEEYGETSNQAAEATKKLYKEIKQIETNKAANRVHDLIEELDEVKNISEKKGIFQKIADEIENVFNVDNVGPEFVEKYQDVIDDWSKGVEGSAEKVQAALIASGKAAESAFSEVNTMGWDESKADKVKTAIQDFYSGIQVDPVTLKVTGEADFQNLTEQLLGAGMSATEVANLLCSIGHAELDAGQFSDLVAKLQALKDKIDNLGEGEELGEEDSIDFGSYGFDATVPKKGQAEMQDYTGGGGGSSGSDKTGKEQLQDKQMELYEKKRDLLSTKRENMNPEDASKYIKEEIALLEKEQKILEKQIKSWKVLMKEKVEEFNEKYPEFEIKLTDDGEIANLADIYAAMEAKYDELMATKGIDHAEEWHKEMMEALDLPVGLQENIDENVALLAQKEKEQAELALQEITDRIDWRVKQIDFEIKKLNYYQEKLLIQAHGNKQTIEAMLEGFKYQEQEMLQLFEKGAALRQGIDELKAAKAQYPGNEQIFDEAILDYQSDLVDLNLDILKLRQEMEELVQNVLDLALDEMDIQNERIEKYIGMLDHFQNIIDLSGRALIDQGTKVQIGAMKVETLINRMSIAKQKMEGLTEATNLAQQALENRKADGDETSVKFWENQVEVLKREMEAATEEFLGDWEAALQAAGELFEMRVELAVQTMSDALSPFSSMELFQSNYEKEKQIQEQYLDDATRLYELNKLNRDLNKNIQDQNDLLARSKLRDIQEEILALQKAGVEMSQYDLDVLQKKYDIRLAEIALMEAQNSKTSMRLIRDAGGNWTYAYDADEEKIEDATQKYEDAVYALDQLAKEYVNDVSDQLIANKQEFLEALADLDRNASDYQDQLLILQEQYMERERYLLDELRKGADETGLAFHETLYGQMTDLKDYEDAYNQFVNNSDVTIAELMTNYKDWQKVVEQAMNVAGTSWEDFGTDMDGTLMSLEEHIQALCDEISELVDVLMGYVAEAIGMVEEWQSKYSKRVDQELATNEAYFESGLGGGGGVKYDPNFDYSYAMTKYLENGGDPNSAQFKQWITERDAKYNDMSAGTDWIDNKKLLGVLGSAVDHDKGDVTKVSTSADALASDVLYADKVYYTQNNYNEVNNGTYVQQGEINADFAKQFGYDTGGYTGDWPIGEGIYDKKGGKLALLHQKELVLNQQDTKNILDAVKMTRSQNLNKSIDDKVQQMLDWSNDKFSRLIREVQLPIHDIQPIEQKVEIIAEFPGVTDQYEIREALSNLSNDASQYLNIKRSLY